MKSHPKRTSTRHLLQVLEQRMREIDRGEVRLLTVQETFASIRGVARRAIKPRRGGSA